MAKKKSSSSPSKAELKKLTGELKEIIAHAQALTVNAAPQARSRAEAIEACGRSCLILLGELSEAGAKAKPELVEASEPASEDGEKDG